MNKETLKKFGDVLIDVAEQTSVIHAEVLKLVAAQEKLEARIALLEAKNDNV